MSKAVRARSTNLVISVADLTVQTGEPRIHDLRLAEGLGFADHHMIRLLIRRHMEALRQFGEVSVTQRKPGPRGGRPGTDYHLNKRQVLYITAKSDTPRAAEITVQMVEVFDAYASGRAAELQARLRSGPQWRTVEAEFPPDVGCVMIEGRPVFFKTGSRAAQPGDLAVIVDLETAELKVERVAAFRYEHPTGTCLVERLNDPRYTLRDATSIKVAVAVVGKVIRAPRRRQVEGEEKRALLAS